MGTNGSFPSPIRVWPENSWPYLVRGSNIKCWCFRNWRRNCMSWPWLTTMCLGLVGNWDYEASFRMEASADNEQLVNDLSWLLISVYIYVHIYIYIVFQMSFKDWGGWQDAIAFERSMGNGGRGTAAWRNHEVCGNDPISAFVWLTIWLFNSLPWKITIFNR